MNGLSNMEESLAWRVLDHIYVHHFTSLSQKPLPARSARFTTLRCSFQWSSF